MSTVMPEAAPAPEASVTPPLPPAVPSPSLVHPSACPSWCQEGRDPRGHADGPRSTAHTSRSHTLSIPAALAGGDQVLLRAELFRLDESRLGRTVLFIEGETDGELRGHDIDILVADLEAFTAKIRTLRARMNEGAPA